MAAHGGAFAHGRNLQLSYVHTNDKINQIYRSPDPANPNVVTFVKENLDIVKLYSVALSRPVSHGNFSAYLTAGMFYDDQRIQDISQQLVNARLGYFLEASPSLRILDNWSVSAYAKYTSTRVDAVYVDNPISIVNLAVSRKFLKDRLKVTLWSNDIFDRNWFSGVVTFNGMSANYISRGDWHYTKIVFNYTFGKLQAKANLSSVGRSELNRINRGQ
ncbi:MAG: outer membrane beta-barrel protein [Bacteroidota bacterium]